MPTLLLVLGVPILVLLAPPPVPADWRPLFDPLVYTSRNGGSGETSMFRWTDGRLYCMHSSGVRSADCPNTIPKGRSFFHIRDVQTGRVVSCAAQSAGHSFFSAVVDYRRKTLWVFGSAQNRAGPHLGPCQMSVEAGCYVGAWSSKDLTNFTETARALTVPTGTMIFNTDVTFTQPPKTVNDDPVLPAHQAIMVMEPRYNMSLQPPSVGSRYSLALNTGTDGDLTRNWQLLSYPLVSPITACPSIRVDGRTGFVYVLGGGKEISLARSKDLVRWEMAKQYMAVPAASLGHAYETSIGQYYSGYWRAQPPASAERLFLHNMTAWNFGVSDADVCCDDDGPAYILHLAIAQFAPKNFTGLHGPGYLAGGSSNMSLMHFLAAHF